MSTKASTVDDLAHDAAMFAQVAQHLADDILGHRPLKQGDMMLLPNWQADLLIFAVHQAKFAANAVKEAVQ